MQCGATESLSNGHVFSRRALSTRWDITEAGNCYCQCWGCNYKHVRDQHPYFQWYIRKYGNENFLTLRERFETHTHYKKSDLVELYENLKKEWALRQ